ncbi:hypothetical protein [Kribbella sp. NPDC003557]|uniref:hypothetical protein n=1 Tax=Kribbella sp. NPDC003557 TaxID=3154449 RepID=UPI0033BBBB97
MGDKFGHTWQYHSRSDRHSKVACWAVLFDLLQASSLLQRHVRDGKVAFGINRQLNDWETGKKKDLDLVIARTPGPGGQRVGHAFDLTDLGVKYGIELVDEERRTLAGLPTGQASTAGATVLVALEAKACMTAHIKALPRLYDELSSSHATVHGDNPNALAVGFVMVNVAETFVSPDLHRREITHDAPAVPSVHNQPHVTERTVERLREIRRRPGPGSGRAGFDALGIMLVSMLNDGSPVHVVTSAPAPAPSSEFNYAQMIGRAAHLYDSSFGNV